MTNNLEWGAVDTGLAVTLVMLLWSFAVGLWRTRLTARAPSPVNDAIITSINGDEISDCQGITDVLARHEDRLVEVVFADGRRGRAEVQDGRMLRLAELKS